MTLQTFLRDSTFEVNKKKDKVETTLNDLYASRSALDQERDALNKTLGTRYESRNKLIEDIGSLESHIRRLEEELNTKRQELDSFKNKYGEVIGDIDRYKIGQKEFEKKMEELNGNIDSKISKLAEYKKEYNKCIYEGFDKYMKNVKNDINMIFAKEIQSASQKEEFLKYEKEKNSNPDLISKHKALEELKTLAEIAEVETVRKLLDENLHKVKNEIEKIYPNAFKIAGPIEMNEGIVTLYYYIENGDGVVLVPYNKKEWEDINNYKEDLKKNQLANFIFWFGKCLELNNRNVKIRKKDKYIYIEVDNITDKKDKSIEINLYGGGKISIILNQLPEEVEREVRL